jgi:hypothetical protein
MVWPGQVRTETLPGRSPDYKELIKRKAARLRHPANNARWFAPTKFCDAEP